MSITDLTMKVRAAENEITEKKGAPSLFALLLREDAPDRWDLVVSASWTRRGQPEVLKYLQQVLLNHLGKDGVLKISRIVLTDPDSDHVRAIKRSFRVPLGEEMTLSDKTLFDMPIKQAVILTSTE
jgi:hypothetical protein